jgi:hypothetical protein
VLERDENDPEGVLVGKAERVPDLIKPLELLAYGLAVEEARASAMCPVKS